MKISKQNYSSKYEYQIHKLPFGKTYKLYIRSINDQYKGQFTTEIAVQTADLGDHLDQSPTLTKTLEDSLEFDLKPLDNRMSTTLTVIVQDFDENKKIDPNIAEQEFLVDNLCNDYGETWISQIVKITKETKKVNVGKEDPSGRSLKPATEYCVTFLIENVYKNSTHTNAYYEKLTTPAHAEPPYVEPPSSSKPHLFIIVIIVIIVLILIGFLIVWYLRRSRTRRRPRSSINTDEHEYESLPFEKTIANNNGYDHLEHR